MVAISRRQHLVAQFNKPGNNGVLYTHKRVHLYVSVTFPIFQSVRTCVYLDGLIQYRWEWILQKNKTPFAQRSYCIS